MLKAAVELGKEATFALMGHKDHQKLLGEIEKACAMDERYLI